jgi:cytochrome c oxidase cbb3-type subunit 3/ubiquinol-cytochrome c reductase cytochrome c subunit
MNVRAVVFLVLAGLLGGCDWHLPGKPIRPEPVKVDSRAAFDRLYFVNCLGCHGPEGRDGPARPMNDPLYQALIPVETLEAVIRDGHGLLMPGFEKTLYGGMSEDQIAAMATNMKHIWGDPAKAGDELPSYAQSPGSGDPAKGRETFATFCGSCHGETGEGKADGAGSVVHVVYLRLVSDQALRSTVICGRLDLGCPDFRGPYPGQPEGRGLSQGEIDDVTAWLISNRRTIAEEAAR